MEIGGCKGIKGRSAGIRSPKSEIRQKPEGRNPKKVVAGVPGRSGTA